MGHLKKLGVQKLQGEGMTSKGDNLNQTLNILELMMRAKKRT